MSDVLDRIRRELQQRLEVTRAAAQEHERVRAALEALEHATRPFEKAARDAAGEASRRGRRLAARARPASGKDGSATTAADAEPRSAGADAPAQRSTRARTSASATRARRAAARPPKTSAEPSSSKSRSRARAGAQPARRRAARGANRAAVLAVVRERPGVTAGELAAASGVSGGTLYALLGRLVEQSELAKRELPGGQAGYTLADNDSAVGDGAGRDAAGQENPQHRAIANAAARQTDADAATPPHADT